MTTSSAGRQPPIGDRYRTECPPGHHWWRPLPGQLGATQCTRCFLIRGLAPGPRVLAGDDLAQVVLAIAPHVVDLEDVWGDIVRNSDYRIDSGNV